MTIPLSVAIGQWGALLTLMVLVVIVYRQLAHVLIDRPGSPVGPIVGTVAVEFAYTRLHDGSRHVFSPVGEPALLAFVDPSCPACEALVANLEKLRERDTLGIRTLLMTSDPPEYLRISEPFQRTRLELGRSESGGPRESYNATATPLMVAIDGTGVIRAARAGVTEARDVRLLREAALAPPKGVAQSTDEEKERDRDVAHDASHTYVKG